MIAQADWTIVTCKVCLAIKDIEDLPTGADLLRNENKPKKHMKMGTCDQAICAVGVPEKNLVTDWALVTCKKCHKSRQQYAGLDAAAGPKFDGRLDRPDKCKHIIPELIHKMEGIHALCGVAGGKGTYDRKERVTCTRCLELMRKPSKKEEPVLRPDYLARAMIKASDVDGALTDIIDNVPWLKKSTLLMMIGLRSITQEMRSSLRKHKEQQEKE